MKGSFDAKLLNSSSLLSLSKEPPEHLDGANAPLIFLFGVMNDQTLLSLFSSLEGEKDFEKLKPKLVHIGKKAEV